MRPALAAMFILGFAGLALAAALTWYGMAWRMGWFEGPPQMARGLIAAAGTPSPGWSRKLASEFPIGSQEDALRRVLRRQGFQVDAQQRRAAYGWARYPCVYTLTVRWRADSSSRVRDVEGGLQNACTDMKRLIPERQPRFRQRQPGPVIERDRELVPRGQSA